MSFNFPWTNRKNNQDYVFAEDVNALAGGIRMAGSHAENVLAAHKQSADHDVRYYTKQQSCDRFANALIGSTIGSTIALTDIQPGATEARELTIYGKTVETGTGDKSPDNPYILTGAGESGSIPIVVSDGTNSQTVNIPVSSPLYSLPNGVSSKILSNPWRVERHSNRVVFSGLEEWGVWNFNAENTITFRSAPVQDMFYSAGLSGVGIRLRTVSNMFKGDTGAEYGISSDSAFSDIGPPMEWERMAITVDQRVGIRVLKSRFAGWDNAWTNAQKVDAFKAWLSDNPVTVIYELEEPIIETIPPLSIPIYAPTSTITTADEVEPEMHVAYNRDLNATLQALQDAIETITGG